MTDEDRRRIADVLNLLPEVRWDRFVEMDGEWAGYGSAFGWVDRDDGKADFVDVSWWPDGDDIAFGVSTSSARYSLEFTHRVNGPDALHFDCQRVEERFGDVVANVVRL